MSRKQFEETIKELLVAEASQESVTDDGDDFDASDGGNFDDTFARGISEGRIELARELLKTCFGLDQNGDDIEDEDLVDDDEDDDA